MLKYKLLRTYNEHIMFIEIQILKRNQKMYLYLSTVSYFNTRIDIITFIRK